MDLFRFLNPFSRNAKRIVKNYNPKVINYNKKYDTNIPKFNQNVNKERATIPLILNINKFDINDPNSVSLIQIQIGSNVSQSINLIPDTSSNDFGLCSEFCGRSLSGDCTNRKDIFTSENSTSFKGNYKPKSINYLDGSIVNGYTGSDFITINSFTFKNKFSLLLFNKISGTLKAQNPVEGIMGLGFSSQVYLRVFNVDTKNIFKISTLNNTTYWKIRIGLIWIDESPLIIPTPVTDSLISTSHNKISLGVYSSEFFKNLNATKASDGNWIMSTPVPISFDVITDSGVIGVVVPSCNMIRGKCVSIFDDSSGPLNSIILGAPFLETIYFIIDNDDHTIRIANKNNFCPISNPSTSTVLTSFTSTTTVLTSFTSTTTMLTSFTITISSFTATIPSFTVTIPSFTFSIPVPTSEEEPSKEKNPPLPPPLPPFPPFPPPLPPFPPLPPPLPPFGPLPPPLPPPQKQKGATSISTLQLTITSQPIITPQPQPTDSFLPTLTGSFISTGPTIPTDSFRHTGPSIPTDVSRSTDLSITIGSSIPIRLSTHIRLFQPTSSSPTDSSRTINLSRGTSQPIGSSFTDSSRPTNPSLPTNSSRHTDLLPTGHTGSLPKVPLSTDSSRHTDSLPKGSLPTDSSQHTGLLLKGSLPTDSSRHTNTLPKDSLPTDSSRRTGSLPKGLLHTDSSRHTGSLPIDSSRHTVSLPKGSLPTDSSRRTGSLPKGSLPTDSFRHTGSLPKDSSQHTGSLPTDSSRHTGSLPKSSLPTDSSRHKGSLPKGSLPTDLSRNTSSSPTDSPRSINTSLLPTHLPQPIGSSIPTESPQSTGSTRPTGSSIPVNSLRHTSLS
ncbi:aspartic peptidase domain-containing protein [Gigaspora rosea]|uniref:Aspartic peptidase domain-containing protein n=1 Tax=Gigaspora rosea TaxID=44941 RepID=A0A397VID4_9GLOM|nr:aspartic peptidase domain-containing protein [Gigaspora rosea]